MSLKNRLDKIAIITPVDKLPMEAAITCPKFMQSQMCRFIGRSDPTFEVPQDLLSIFNAAAYDLKYTKATSKKGHEFGQFSLWPKMCGFEATPCWSAVGSLASLWDLKIRISREKALPKMSVCQNPRNYRDD